MMSHVNICLFFLIIPWVGKGESGLNQDCCERKQVKGLGSLNGVYKLQANEDEILDRMCVDDCVYSKEGEDQDERYCFKSDPKSNEDNTVCQSEDIPTTIQE